MSSSLRKTSQVKEFPFNDSLVAWVVVLNDGTVLNPAGDAERRNAASIVQQGRAKLYIAWPGRTRTDLFEVDQQDQIDMLCMALARR